MIKTRRSVVVTVALLVIITLIYSISGTQSNVTLNDFKDAKVEFIKPVEITKDSINVGESIIADDSSESVELDAAKDDKSINSDEQVPLQVGQGAQVVEEAFMPKMANETLKAQLGNSSWRLLHTILARYPETPSKEQQMVLKQFITLFAQIYPCGDCARHFQKLLEKFPPQISSRKTAALWGCHIHNKVNDRLGKEMYDCTTILTDYDCGCGDDENELDITLGGKSLNNLNGIEIDEEVQQLG
ncbi:FAD-linked sulfhydryl oxidase Erv2p [[Candida] jaroonii]|uniref:FAD-linked sulfhydryl oxidase Erv2p n=1 Tax=[Candida] jaroonii TaxID=467808 RepID=A0ACA9Y6X3_9ASCO|nr:FAD-linked sulfhydryl oxidase Erv2p [[Candida] jaroonii]